MRQRLLVSAVITALFLGWVIAAASDSPGGDGWINPWRTTGEADPDSADEPDWINPWRAPDGFKADAAEIPDPAARLVQLNNLPRNEYNTIAGGDAKAMNDRGIDSADVKWRRQARLTGVNMRMLNGPEMAFSNNGFSSNTERGSRSVLGAVSPINNRWELAALNNYSSYQLRETGGRAALEAVTLRLNGSPSVSKRPWLAVTPFAGLRDGKGRGVGITAGYSWAFSGGISLDAEGYVFRPWDDSYDTIVQDGRQHGVSLGLTMPVDRRLSFTAGVDYEWLELGPNAAAGKQSAGRQGGWDLRANYVIWRRDGAFMGYGFRDETLWNEQLVPVQLGLFGDLLWSRYVRPESFTALSPSRKMLRQRIGLFYEQAISPHLGVNSEAYVGRDTRRDIDFGKIYGVTMRLTVAINSRLKLWAGMGYETDRNDVTASDEAETRGGVPTRNFTFGLNCNF